MYGTVSELPERSAQRRSYHDEENGTDRVVFRGLPGRAGNLEETSAIAVKRVLAWQLEQAMEERQMSKSAMAQAMRTSRSQLDRILDPDNDHIRLDTLTAAANVLGLNLRIELVGYPSLPAEPPGSAHKRRFCRVGGR